MTLSVLELFAGAGGAALGLEAAGLHHVGLVELDADACLSLRAAGLGPVIEADARDLATVAAQMSGAPDVLWSSFPCQGWSTAGSRKGAQDERNGWPWTVAALDRFEPSWFLGENVTGLLQHRGSCTARGGQGQLFNRSPELTCAGCYFERIILPELRHRFAHVGWWLLDAADYGVPQHRRRVILWAGPSKLEQPTATHGPGLSKPWASMAGALGLEAGARTKQTRMKPSGPTGRGEARSLDRAAGTITTKGNAYFVAPAPTVTTTEVKGTRACAASGWTFNGGPDRASDALALMTGYANRPAPTVSGADGHGLGGKSARDGMQHTIGRRRLTVEECACLQDFPDGYPLQGTQTARYRQVGNAVPPTLARVVGLSLVAAFTDNQRRGNP